MDRELAIIKGLAPTEAAPAPAPPPSALLQQVARLRVLPAAQLEDASGAWSASPRRVVRLHAITAELALACVSLHA